MASRFLLVFLAASAGACSTMPSLQHLQAVDGRLIAMVSDISVGAVVTDSRSATLMISGDGGATWDTRYVPGLQNVAFWSATDGLLLIDGDLYETLDGAASWTPVEGVPSGVAFLRSGPGWRSAGTYEATYVFRDWDPGWTAYQYPTVHSPRRLYTESVLELSPRAEAVAAGGRLYSRTATSSDWTESIVGEVIDLFIDDDGVIYALTGSDTVAVVEQDVRNIPFDHALTQGFWSPRFLPWKGSLYFLTLGGVYRVTAGELDGPLPADPDQLARLELAQSLLIEPDRLLRAERTTDTVDLLEVDLTTGSVRVLDLP